jgi:hypothetical protein
MHAQTDYATQPTQALTTEQALAQGATEDRVMFYDGLREIRARLDERREQLVAAVEEIDRQMHGVSAALEQAPEAGGIAEPAVGGMRGR